MTNAVPQNPDELSLLEQAALWFDRWSAGLSGEELREFEKWHANPGEKLAFAEIEAVHGAMKHVSTRAEILALRHEALSRIVLPEVLPIRRHWIGGAVAASMAILAAFTAWPHYQPRPARNPVHVAQSQPTTYRTAVGEQLTVALSDGSSVTLNTDSRLHLAYSADERRIILDRGQALFRVAKGQRRPFIVQALDRMVTAHGTTFDVRISPGRTVTVALVEGEVSVVPVGKRSALPAELKPEDVLVASANEMRVSRDVDVRREVSWRDGLIIFEDESLADATEEVNRYVTKTIVLKDQKLRQIRVSGAFRTGETGAFVEALEQSFPVRVIARGPDKIVLGYRN